MKRIGIKRVYEPAEATDGYRVLVDKLWPRGLTKERLCYDLWAKELAPSSPLRHWFHADPTARWEEFRKRYTKELENSAALREFAASIRAKETVTLLYASRSTSQNHALILRDYLSARVGCPLTGSI